MHPFLIKIISMQVGVEDYSQDFPEVIIRVILMGLPYSGAEEVASILVEQYGLSLYRIEEAGKPKEQSSKSFIRDICFQEFVETQKAVVVLENYGLSVLRELRKRNYVNTVYVESSFRNRYINYLKHTCSTDDHSTLTYFMGLDEAAQQGNFQNALEFARVRIMNTSTPGRLREEVRNKIHDVLRPYRPSWDEYFMKIAEIARRRSNCMKTSVGCVIVNNNNRVVSTGYNGTPKGLRSCFMNGCERCNSNEGKKLDQCLCLHAQESAIIEVGIGKTAGCKLYTTYYPCFSCAKVIKQAGICKIYYADIYDKQDSGKLFIQDNFDPKDVLEINTSNLYY